MTKKQEAIKVISDLPDSVDYEDIMYHLYVLEQIEKGRKDVKDGNLISIEELEKEVSNW